MESFFKANLKKKQNPKNQTKRTHPHYSGHLKRPHAKQAIVLPSVWFIKMSAFLICKCGITLQKVRPYNRCIVSVTSLNAFTAV